MMFFSASAFAQNTTVNDEEWEGATNQVASEQYSTSFNNLDADSQLELSHPWHYGRQDSDTIVNRERHDMHHD